MKRIVIDARKSGTTTGRYVDKLIEHLHKLQPNIEFVVLTMPQRVSYLKKIAPNFEIVESPIKDFTIAEQTTLLKQINQLRPDLVFFPIVQQPLLYRGPVVTALLDLTTVRFRNPAKNPVVYTLKQRLYGWMNKRVARKSKHIITPTEFVRQDIAQYCHVSPNKITAIYDAADKIEEAAKPMAALANKDFLLAVGHPGASKNLNRLVDAFDKLNRPDLWLIFVGKTTPDYTKLADYAKTKVNGQRIIFSGFIDDNQLRWLYEHAKAYVFPSLSEGFGLPGLEAMLYELPVVSSQATCLPEVYQDAALYFDPLKSEDMARTIGQVLDDTDLAKKLAANGKKVVGKYSWRKTAEQTLDVLKDALQD